MIAFCISWWRICCFLKPSKYASIISKDVLNSNFAIDYSLSPENTFPKAIDEAVSSFNALLEKGFKSKIFFGVTSWRKLKLGLYAAITKIKSKITIKIIFIITLDWFTGEGSMVKENSKTDPYLSYDNWLNTALSMQKTVKEWCPKSWL